ncbi:MAG: Serine hydrolase [Candidatus Saccharibacteria bacterium]|nr:Serine hydrolase [Candidatus Saccharibacteria bacterium]
MAELQQEIEQIVAADEKRRGVEWSVLVTDPEQTAVTINKSRVHDSCSLAKLAIIHAVELKGPNLDETTKLTQGDKRPGDGFLYNFPIGYDIKLRDAARIMLSESDNTAARIVVRALGGPVAVNNILSSSPLDLHLTRLTPSRGDTYRYGVTVAGEIARLMRHLTQKIDDEAPVIDLARNALHRSSRWYGLRRDIDKINGADEPLRHWRKLLRAAHHLATPLHERLLPPQHSVYGRLVDSEWTYAASAVKDGSSDDSRHEAGQIGQFIVVAMSQGNQEQPYGRRHSSNEVFAKIGKLVRDAGKLDPTQ